MPNAPTPIRIWIKPKIIAGFIIILAFAIASVTITYNGVLELSKTKQSLSQPNKKLVYLNSILADIYEAEGNIRTYTLTRNDENLNGYFSILLRIDGKVDSLMVFTKDNQSQRKRIRLIKELLEKKGKVLDELLALKQQDHSSAFFESAMQEIERVQKQPLLRSPLYARTTTTTTSKKDTSFNNSNIEKNGFFNRLKSWFSGNEKRDTSITQVKVETKIDTLFRASLASDSLITNLIGILNQIKHDQEAVKERISKKEMELLSSDKVIMDEIRSVVSLLEREELSLAYKRSNDAENVVYKSAIIVLVLGGAALVLLILFLAMIFRDISRSNYLRNQLFEAKMYAEKLLRVKEQFLANMSHEIRTPLSSIIGLTRQLSKTELLPQQSEYIQQLNISSEHLLGVINDILDFSKLEAGQLKLESLPFNLPEVLNEAVNSMGFKAREKGLDITLNVNELQGVTLWGDSFRLKQVILNLLSNSIKFTERGGVSITARCMSRSDTTALIQLVVADTGVGIPGEQQQLIFEEFTQSDPGVTRRQGGTGLGLTIVKRIVELQNGEIQLASKINEGTTVTITIPYQLTGSIQTAANLKNDFELPQNIKVLVVDDDDINRVITLEMFKSLGISADSTNNPKVAMEMISNNHYQVVLTDIQMPEISGYEIAGLIEHQFKAIHVIAITANSMIDNPEHFLEKGFSGHLIKPFNEDDLFNAIAPLVGFKKQKSNKMAKEVLIDDVFDLSDIYRFAGGDKNSVKLILSTFLENTTKNFAELNSMVRGKDLVRASAIAHKMKSGFNQFKIYHIAGILYKIEKLENSQGKFKTALVLLNELNQQIKPVIKLLRKELVELSEPDEV